MAQNRFGRKEFVAKRMQCSCGGDSKLSKRRNFPHGRKSDGVTYIFYKCKVCNKETPLTKPKESRR